MNGKRALNKSSLLSRQKLERDSPILAVRNESDSEIGHLKSLCPKEIRSVNQSAEFRRVLLPRSIRHASV